MSAVVQITRSHNELGSGLDEGELLAFSPNMYCQPRGVFPMVGSRHPNAARGQPNARLASGRAVLLDDVCVERRYVDGGRVVAKQEQQIDRKLETIIDGEIIPRLMLLHRQPQEQPNHISPNVPPINAADHVEEFADLVIRHDTEIILAYIKALLDKGLAADTLLLELLAPAARRMGELWDADVVDFVDVTIGTSRLQQILHHFTFPSTREANEPGRRVLLVPTPSEQHTFGLLMVSQFFRREGWDVWGNAPIPADDLPTMVADQWFALVGFSLSCERLVDTLCSTINAVRRSSRNQAVRIVVGGPIFAQDQSLKLRVGADLAVSDAREAVNLAESVLDSAPGWQG